MPPIKRPAHHRRRTFLLEWREYRELTQEDAADRVGVDRTTLGRIEAGKLPYNQDFLEKLAFAYMCEPTDLLSVNPRFRDPPTLIYEKLRAAPREMQDRAVAIIDAMLKAG
jgi:transcriptional regulator with XRE-family HTH domain